MGGVVSSEDESRKRDEEDESEDEDSIDEDSDGKCLILISLIIIKNKKISHRKIDSLEESTVLDNFILK